MASNSSPYCEDDDRLDHEFGRLAEAIASGWKTACPYSERRVPSEGGEEADEVAGHQSEDQQGGSKDD